MIRGIGIGMVMGWAAVTILAAGFPASAASVVPFVGCPSQGQSGEFDPPTGSPETVALPSALAEQIAFYKGEFSDGVFAPRGWHCQIVFGSSGGTLVITPAVVDVSQLYRSKVRGQAVELESISGGGSGRFEVAAYASFLFPDAAAEFIKRVSDFEPEATKDTLEGFPHAKDVLGPVIGNVAKFKTPPNAKGLGTACSLAPLSEAVRGMAVLLASGDGGVSILRVRLKSDLQDVEAAIFRLNQERMQK